MDDEVQRLMLRLALLRHRIDRTHLLIQTLPIHAQSAMDAEGEPFAERVLVSRETHPTWTGESVVAWYRKDLSAGWASQLACPHAAISLAESDIEDLRMDYPSTAGPCIACPAHMYVFDLGSGACLTDEITPSARVYDVLISTHSSGTAGIWVAREPRCTATSSPPAAVLQGGSVVKKPGGLILHAARPGADAPRVEGSPDCHSSRKVGNAIQLRLVEKGLRRRFGDFED
jgi:nitrite reductase/ring-hydroxylating ferredoxin subunit